MIRLAGAGVEAMIAHARTAAPAECCGLLLGRSDAIVEAVPARNLAESFSRFFVDPRDHIDIRRGARARGLDVVGFYHSHPHSAASPSAADLAEAAYLDELYAIVGLSTDPPEVRLFRMEQGNFREVPFVTVA